MTSLLSEATAKSYPQCYDPEALEITPHFFSQIYKELRRIAHRQLNSSWSLETISTTVLVNEAYLKLFKQELMHTDKAHFLSIAATAMRQIIINYAEQKRAAKRGGDWLKITFEHTLAGPQFNLDNVLAVDKALKQVKALDADLARLVEMRFFAGMTENEIASAMGISDRSVRRNWRKAKALLSQFLSCGKSPAS